MINTMDEGQYTVLSLLSGPLGTLDPCPGDRVYELCDIKHPTSFINMF